MTNAVGKSQIIDSKFTPRKGQPTLVEIHRSKNKKNTEAKKECEQPLEQTGGEEEDNSLKIPPSKILAPDFDALDIHDSVYGTQASPENKKGKHPKLSPNGNSQVVLNDNSQDLQKTPEKYKPQPYQEKLLSGQNNEIFMKQHVGKMGQLKGVNLEKVRLSIKEQPSALKPEIKKSVLQVQTSHYEAVNS